MENEIRMYQYMVDFNLPQQMNREFMELIPLQREMVNRYFMEQRLFSYTLSKDRKKLWATFIAENESDVIEMVDAFPLTCFMEYEIHPLLFNELVKIGMPSISLN